MKNFKEFKSGVAEKLVDLAKKASAKAEKKNTIEAHEKALEAHTKARYAVIDHKTGDPMYHYHKELEHSKALHELRTKKGPPVTGWQREVEKNGIKFHARSNS